MPKNKNTKPQESKKQHDKKTWHDDLHPETKKSIFAIIAFLFSAIFILSYLGKAGAVGGYMFKALDLAFGKGYFFAPIVSTLVGFSLIFSFKRKLYFATFLGAIIFLISSLSIIEIIFSNKTGGYIGFLISMPLLSLFDFWASLIIVSSLFLVSLLLILNIPVFNLWKKDEEENEENEKENEIEDGQKTIGAIKTILENINTTVKESISKKELPEEQIQTRSSIIQDSVKTQDGDGKIFLDSNRRLKRLNYSHPPLELLSNDKGVPSSGDVKANANVIARTLENFGIDVDMGEVSIGPTVTQYTLKPAEGVKLSKITALHNNLALALAAHPIRIEAPIPGKSLIGIEIPNKSIALVGLRSLLDHEVFQKSLSSLIFVLGRDVSGSPVFADLGRMPHLLIAGATGTGKSVSIHTIITSFLYRNSPETLRFIIIDPKRVELSIYNDIPHLLTPVITDSKKTIQALRWAVKEMERRYEVLSQIGARDIASFNSLINKKVDKEKGETLPYLVIVIDELADIMLAYPREVEASIIRLAQMARAVGIHLIVSTQRPSVEVITGLIKANITSRIAFQVASQIDSRTILDMSGAEKLLGNGDMLFLAGDTAKPRRIQGAFISETEVKKVVDFLREERDPEYEEIFANENKNVSTEIFNDDDLNGDDDELYEEAKKMVMEAGKASASYLQRRLRVGYARAARLLDMLEEEGVIGPGEGAKPREVLIKTADVKYDESHT